MWETCVCCCGALPVVLTKTHRNTPGSQPGRGSPGEQSNKTQIWGSFKRETRTCSLPLSLPCTAARPDQPSQLRWKNPGPFACCWNVTALNWAIWGKNRTGTFWCPLPFTAKALGSTAAMNVITVVAFLVSPTVTVMSWVTPCDQPSERYLPPHWAVVKGFKNSKQSQLERGVCHIVKLFMPILVNVVCQDVSEQQSGFGRCCRRAKCFPRACL